MPTQNNPVGNGMRVLSVSGEVLTRGADGNMRQVVPGEYLAPGDILVTRAGAVLLQNAQGQYAEIPPNHSLTVSPAMVGLFLPGGTEAVLSPSSDESQTGALVNTAGTDDGFGESGGGAIRNWNGHGFVRLPRINFFHDQNLSRWDNLGRDVNETFTFMGRHTMNPRIGYEYSTDRAPLDEFRPETDRPWWGDREPSRDDFINRPPLVSPPDGGVTDEDVPLVLDLLKYASDPEGKPVAIISAEAGSGTVVINPDGTVTYTPNEDFHGEDTITFTVSDGFGGTTTSTVTVTVNPVVDIAPDAAETTEDTPVVTDVLANDTFGPNAEVTAITQGSGGSVTINPDGTVTYTPGPGFQGLAEGETGTDTYTYTVTTAAGNTETTTVTVIIHGLNDGPVGSDLPGQSDLDGEAVAVSVAGAFSDPDATDVLTYSTTGLPAGLTIDPLTAMISGTIDNSASQGSTGANPAGTYTVVVTATDPHGASVSETFQWTVTNPGPDAVNDVNSVEQNEVLTVGTAGGVLANDADPDGDVLTVSAVNGVAGNLGNPVAGSDGGTFTLNGDGSYTFDPGNAFEYLAAGESKTTSITYTISDGEGGTDTATLTVTVNGENQAPVGNELPPQSDLDGESVTLSLAGAFSDPDTSDVLTYSAEGLPAGLFIDPVSGVISGTIDNSASQAGTSGNPDGTYTVVITATDPQGASVNETFIWTVANPVPDAVDDVNSTGENTPLTVSAAAGVLGNDTDPDGDALTVSAVNGAAGNIETSVAGSDGGTFTLNGDGSYTFDPGTAFDDLAAGESKTTSINYTVSDGEGGTDTATLTITVNGVNDAPVAGQLPPQSDLDGESVTLSLAGAFNVPDGTDVLTYSAEGLPQGLTIDPLTGVISGTIDNSASQGSSGAENPAGTYAVVITATDPHGASVSETFTWTVGNPAPDAVDDANSTGENTPLTVSAAAGVLGNDTDPDGDALTVSAVNGAAGNIGNSVAGSNGGTFTLNADGSYDFDPGTAFDDLAVGENRTTSINYTVSDGEGGTDTATLTITVNGINDAPVVNELPPQSDLDGESVTLSLAGAFSDPDTSDVLT
ncbi:MAG: Ig-like domain-containing protein, partial [Synergistaceae bacterium]|nr:Ig-like domain-containing protein [Synergistaceae bacterium]